MKTARILRKRGKRKEANEAASADASLLVRNLRKGGRKKKKKKRCSVDPELIRGIGCIL